MRDTIDMAREAGWTSYDSQDERFKAFADLVRADARKQVALDKKAENARELGLDYEPVLKDNSNYRYDPPEAQPAPVQEPVGRTDQQIVDQTEELAVWLLSWCFNHQPETDTPMRESTHPFAERCWAAACHIQEMLTATDPENAVAELDVDATPPAAQPAPVQEPETDSCGSGAGCLYKVAMIENLESEVERLKAAQRQWTGLTDEERTEIRREHYARTLPLMDAVEAKLKEKNT
jgi:hypothetical protein